MQPIKNLIRYSNSFGRLLAFLNSPIGNINLQGCLGSFNSLLIAMLSEETNAPIAVIANSTIQAESVLNDLANLTDKNHLNNYPPMRTRPTDTLSLTPGLRNERVDTILSLKNRTSKILVMQPESLFDKFPTQNEVEVAALKFKVGDSVKRETLLADLSGAGYQREKMVNSYGQYSMRGYILDVFPFGSQAPIRLELDGDQIVSLRIFDTNTQRTLEKVENVNILIEETIDFTGSIFDLFDKETKVIWLGLGEIEARFNQFLGRAKSTIDIDEEIEASKIAQQFRSEILTKAEPFTNVFVNSFGEEFENNLHFNVTKPKQHSYKLEDLQEYLAKYTEQDYKTWICTDTEGEKKRLDELLSEYELDSIATHSPALSEGFVYSEGGVVLLNAHEIFNRRRIVNRPSKFRRNAMTFDRSSLSEGDYVVHSEYGIGLYEGLRIVKVRNQSKECLRIKYKEDTIVHVPIENFNLVEKYVGGDGHVPTLTRIGTKDWEKAKSKVKKTLQDISAELIRLYAERKDAEGYAYPPDTVWQNEMETSFEFIETPDQAQSIEEVKRDLEAPSPMDRLLCGDVGFGKTEVAIRAAFKVVQENKQVAILVPTTVLADQHYHTFVDRLSAFPVKVESLSRFRTTKEQKEVVEELKKGNVDIVIGTHRLLSKDVNFKDLGLVVVDEEHRFGVKHKEKLKEMKINVDFLTMSATPIPRTLNLALMGARDTSQINTPPIDRLPIQTEAYAFSEDIIRFAIIRELDRGGQVYFVHNQIRSILAVKALLERLVPDIRVAVGHGQMKENYLEGVMSDFINGKFDVLLSTTIIESGLDIPNVNTMIIHRADRFGLAQLYQLRGRIGRSNRQAYCILLTPIGASMSRDARLRLKTISELTEFGSGMELAMRDMEIRGVGNLLGAEQSGNVNTVGFNMYTKILEEAVLELQGKKSEVAKSVETKVEWDGVALISRNFIEDGDTRYSYYKKLADSQSIIEIDNIANEIRDRFGKLPIETRNFIDVMRIRCYGRSLKMTSIQLGKHMLVASLSLPTENNAAQKTVSELVEASAPNQIEFSLGKEVQLIYRGIGSDVLTNSIQFLHHIANSSIFSVPN